jgi:hypothetical protein
MRPVRVWSWRRTCESAPCHLSLYRTPMDRRRDAITFGVSVVGDAHYWPDQQRSQPEEVQPLWCSSIREATASSNRRSGRGAARRRLHESVGTRGTARRLANDGSDDYRVWSPDEDHPRTSN